MLDGLVSLDTLGEGIGRIGGRELSDERVEYALTLGFKSLVHLRNKYHGQRLIICGGGPSLKDTLPDIRRKLRLSKRTKVMAVNKTHDWLLDKGLRPDFGIMIDPKPWVANYQTPTKGVIYCLGSKLDSKTLQKFKGHETAYLWHNMEYADEAKYFTAKHPQTDQIWIPGYSTCGLRAINVAYELGFRAVELHGFDCSHRDTETHAYDKGVPRNDILDETLVLTARDGTTRRYRTDRHMARQLNQFGPMLNSFHEGEILGLREPMTITVAGTGALPYVAAKKWGMHADKKYNDNPESMKPDNVPVESIDPWHPGGMMTLANMPVVNFNDMRLGDMTTLIDMPTGLEGER
jgi:uncharacterized Rossmann fold enzyme